MTFNGPAALERGQTVFYITPCGAWQLTRDGLVFTHVFPGKKGGEAWVGGGVVVEFVLICFVLFFCFFSLCLAFVARLVSVADSRAHNKPSRRQMRFL